MVSGHEGLGHGVPGFGELVGNKLWYLLKEMVLT